MILNKVVVWSGKINVIFQCGCEIELIYINTEINDSENIEIKHIPIKLCEKHKNIHQIDVHTLIYDIFTSSDNVDSYLDLFNKNHIIGISENLDSYKLNNE